MVDYKKTRIYKIVLANGLIYVGATTQAFSMRKCGHVKDCKRYPNRPLYAEVTKNGYDWRDIELTWVENVECNSIEESLARERHYIDLFGATLNKCIPGRTWKVRQSGSFYKEDREEYLAYQHKYSQIKAECPHCGAEHRKGWNLNQHVKAIHPST